VTGPPKRTYKDEEPMKPEDRAKKFEEEREEVQGQKRRPYITPELRRFGMAEELTGDDAAPSGFGFDG
jgi:hypothetical protein